VYLSFEELETLRLVDLEGMEQAQAAFCMGVSRKTLWNDLKSARKKVRSSPGKRLGDQNRGRQLRSEGQIK
jgi:Predicted DNA-binding proteins